MHSSIPPMIDVGVLIRTRFYFTLVKHGIKPSLKKRFYQVKIKSLEVTSLRKLGQLMGQLQWQAFRKAYCKIWDLTMAEVSTEAISSLTQYYDQPLRCFTFGDFQLSPMVEEFEEILGCPLGGRKPYLFSGFYPSLARISKKSPNLGAGIRPPKASRKWGGRNTEKIFGGKTKNHGR